VNSGEQGDETKQKKKKEEGRADLRWLQPLAVLLEATSGGASGSRWLQPLLSLSIFFLCSFSLQTILPFLLFFFFSFGPLASPFSTPFVSSRCALPLYIYR
jgi:hypothetical protein